MDTLVVCSAYMPVRKVSWQDAMSMLFSGRASVVSEYSDRVIRTVDEVIPMPSVIRIVTGYVKKMFKRGMSCIRKNVWLRDNKSCQYCAKKLNLSECNLDHVVPKSRGGAKTWENIVASCYECNNVKKRNRTPEEAGMELLKKPERPKHSNGYTKIRWEPFMPEEWRDFLTE